MKLTLFSIIVLKFLSINYCWNLNNYNITSNYYISSIGIYYNRVFLALSRTINTNNLTIIEVNDEVNENPSNNSRQNKLLLEFPQTWNNCKHIQNAISLKIETNRARLWILDQGNNNCQAKIIIYNLLQNIPTHFSEFQITNDLNKPNFLLVDTTLSDFSLNKAFVGYQQSNFLSIFNLNKMKWRHFVLINYEMVLSTEFLALSKRRNLIFMTGSKEIGIYGLKLSEIDGNYESQTIIKEINVTYFGDKLGPSSGLVLDYKEGLSYYLINDYAIVRWNTRKPSQAENYQVLLQSYNDLPFVSELFLDSSFNTITALINNCNPTVCNNSVQKNPTIKHLIKLLIK